VKTRVLAGVGLACASAAVLAGSANAGGRQVAATPPASVPGLVAVEVEDFVTSAQHSNGTVAKQEMRAFGQGWSGAQLFWRPILKPPLPSVLTFTIRVPAAGVYNIALRHTVAPDYGKFSVEIEGAGVLGSVNGYAKAVEPRTTTLEPHSLTAGDHRVGIWVFSKDVASGGYAVGLDRLELRRTSSASPASDSPPDPPVDALVTETGKLTRSDQRTDTKQLTNALDALHDDKTELEKKMASMVEQMDKAAKGLALTGASRAGGQTRYSFSGTFTHPYKSGLRAFVATYDVTVKARWSPTAREAHESISFQSGPTRGGEVAVTFACSGDPFLAFPGAWPTCEQKAFGIEADGEEAARWQQIVKEKPLTFRRADPATAHAMMADSSSTAPAPPPPPNPTPKPSEPRLPGRTETPGAAVEFRAPTWRGRRVDLCLRWSADCGQPAADEFCRRSGFARATAWKPDEGADETLVIGDNRPCSDPRCTGFATISCAK
jgi:hypothetical protein